MLTSRNFRLSILLALAFAVSNAAAETQAAEQTVVRDVFGAEGPLVVDGSLYFVSWMADTLSKWDGKKVTVLNHTPGCGHNGLALTRHRTFMLACTDDPGAILELDLNGKPLHRWDRDSAGKKFVGGINDLVVTANDGVYATVFGPFNGPVATDVVGRILYLAPGSDKWIDVADDLDYANGIGVSPDQKTLYVSETVGNRILKFTVNPDGTLSHRANFALLNLLAPDPVKSWFLGPDSMKIAKDGDIYVAQWTGGRIFKLSPQGKLLHLFPIAAGKGTTNVAFDRDERNLYVTVVKDTNDPAYRGSIVKIPNAK
jgi:gluconolactonase